MSWEPVTYCNECNEPFDVYQAPEDRICECCKELIINSKAHKPEGNRMRKVRKPSGEEMYVAAQWLRVNEGDKGESDACHKVADWLDYMDWKNDVRAIARAAKVPVAVVHERLLREENA